jgi:hypothetical protein
MAGVIRSALRAIRDRARLGLWLMKSTITPEFTAESSARYSGKGWA